MKYLKSHSLIECKNEDVRYTRGKEALMFMNGKFHPICKRFFWDSRHGSDLFCKKLGYDGANYKKSNYDLTADGVSLGDCVQGAKHFNTCTKYADPNRSCPLFQIGGACNDNKKYCIPGESQGMKIECAGGNGRRSMCEGNKQLLLDIKR